MVTTCFNCWLVHERETDLGQVHLLDVETTMAGSNVHKPLAECLTHPSGSGAGDDHLQDGLVHDQGVLSY